MSTGPVVLGGRIEVPSAGFALEVPEGWYAFDLSAPDLLAEMESFDRVTAVLAPQMAAVSLESLAPDIAAAVPDAALPLVAFAPFDGPTAGENCVMVVEPMATESLELMVAQELLGLRAMSDIEGVVPRFIDLPTGRLAVAEYAAPHPAVGELERSVFFLLHDGWGYSLTCTDASRHADRWLSIAETVEFLPEEEAATGGPGSIRSPSASPVSAGHRIEMPEGASQPLIAPQHRVAITVPATWEQRTVEPDGEPLSSSSQVRRQELVLAVPPLSEPINALCVIWVYSTADGSAVSIEQEVDGWIEDLVSTPENELVTPVAEVVELPAGPARHLVVDQLSPTPSRPEAMARVSQYFLARDDELYVSWCRRGPRDDDDWLSIAETIEFLPEE